MELIRANIDNTNILEDFVTDDLFDSNAVMQQRKSEITVLGFIDSVPAMAVYNFGLNYLSIKAIKPSMFGEMAETLKRKMMLNDVIIRTYLDRPRCEITYKFYFENN